MIPVTVHAFISAPREELFDFLADFGVRPAWLDHFVDDYRLASPHSKGSGAGARFLLGAPGYRHYVESTIVEADRPLRMVEALHGGRNGRSRGEWTWELARQGSGLTRVESTLAWEPGTPREAFKEKFGSARWTRRQLKIALERLRVIFEEQPGRPLARATIAGLEPLRSPRFGVSQRIARG
jgi:polyketide cyclase/dehydrase/lipid transport protein